MDNLTKVLGRHQEICTAHRTRVEKWLQGKTVEAMPAGVVCICEELMEQYQAGRDYV